MLFEYAERPPPYFYDSVHSHIEGKGGTRTRARAHIHEQPRKRTHVRPQFRLRSSYNGRDLTITSTVESVPAAAVSQQVYTPKL